MDNGIYLFPIQYTTRPPFILICWDEIVFKVHNTEKVYITPYGQEFFEEYNVYKIIPNSDYYKNLLIIFLKAYNRNLATIHEYRWGGFVELK